MMNLVPANVTHLDSVVQLEKATFPDDAISKRVFAGLSGRTRQDFFVMLNDKRVVGYYVVLFRNNTNLARLYALVLSPQFRGNGFGKQLLQHAEDPEQICDTAYSCEPKLRPLTNSHNSYLLMPAFVQLSYARLTSHQCQSVAGCADTTKAIAAL